MRLIDEISFFLEEKGFVCSRILRDGHEVISTESAGNGGRRTILPLEIAATTPETAVSAGNSAHACVMSIQKSEGYPLIITEDRWHLQKEMTQARLLAHLETFTTAYARNCEVRRIEKAEAQQFLKDNHSYGYAACRYHYGLFLKRHTGHKSNDLAPGTLIAVATFSNARKWKKQDMIIRSYEWTRYASLPFLRISGGMGKILKAFIEEVGPDDIMSYADLEWSEGDVYRQLGFILEGHKEPVTFMVDTRTWKRFPVRPGMTGPDGSGLKESDGSDMKEEDKRFFRNFGSNKYRLKLTEYE